MPESNIAIILLGTKYPGNIGSAARAMFNMGLSRLILAAPKCSVNEESYRLARSGGPILDSARTCRSLESALRGIGFLVGTTGKTGGYRARTLSPRSLAPRILDHAAGQKVGILFGPEDTGLVDHDLGVCQLLMRIPTRPNAASINLAQSVMIVCYELLLGTLEREPGPVPALASVEQVEAMYAQFEKALLEIGFLHSENTKHMMMRIRRMLGKAGLERSDVGVLRGIARQIHWFAGSRGK
ncbi:MAG: RNA methyltransferase [Acidobacteria bacterium]|nr:RNA methyltransferase [Acidobacteriota bacterium]